MSLDEERVSARTAISASLIEAAKAGVFDDAARRLRQDVRSHVERTYPDAYVKRRIYYVTYEEVIESPDLEPVRSAA